MKVIRREWFDVSRSDEWRLYPIGDIHLGNRACDEKMLQATVDRVAADDRALWIGLGDYADFIGRSDRRFDVASLADWMQVVHLGDIAKAQRERFVEYVAPIAGKCLGLIEGNHERAIHKYYERDVYAEIVSAIKDAGGFEPDDDLAFGYSGWLMLHFYRSDKRERGSIIRINLHHGFVGGKLAGAKALNMQRWLWTHEADLVIMGHSHNSGVQPEAVEKVRGNRVMLENRLGCYAGTYMSGAGYAEEKGYLPLALTQPVILLQPGAHEQRDQIRVVSSA
jgi:predicted phosphodiesterase